MNQSNSINTFDEVQWIDEQIKRYGPIVGGEALRILLGFRTYDAFQKARRHSKFEIALFRLSGRQGHFAMTSEACAWLVDQRKASVAAIIQHDSSVIKETNEEML